MCARVRERLLGPARLHSHLHDAVAAQLGPFALHETGRELNTLKQTFSGDFT
jgi:hypothetical protein